MAQTVRLLDSDEAKAYVGGPTILALMEEHQWIKPSVKQGRLLRYDCKDLDQACDRLASGDFPGGVCK